MLFLYFTNLVDAKAIVASGELLPCTYLSGINDENCFFAAPVGGEKCAEVQHSVNGRTHAVLFETETVPSTISPVEVEWQFHGSVLEITDAMVITADEADELLDKSAGFLDPYNGDWKETQAHNLVVVLSS